MQAFQYKTNKRKQTSHVLFLLHIPKQEMLISVLMEQLTSKVGRFCAALHSYEFNFF